MSERIINISDLENIIQDLRLLADALCNEAKKESSSMQQIDELSEAIRAKLTTASAFEFCIERRKISEEV